jgi:hypothetical protein
MALGELGMQFAQQALLNVTAPKETAPPAPVVTVAPDPTGFAMLGQIAAMQKALKEEEELIVHVQAAGEKLRVVEIFLPSPQVAVVSGFDANRALVRVISPVSALQLVCRTGKVSAGAKAMRVALVTPKPKDSNS